MRATVPLRALEAVAEDHQELDLRQVLRRQGIHVHREVRDDAGGLEDRSQALLEVAGLVGLVADQDQRMRPGIGRGRDAAVERGDRDGQLPVDVLDVLGGRVVVGHPDEAVGGEADLVAKAGAGPALGDVVADLPAELGQEPALAGEELGAAPRAEAGDDVRRREGLQPAQGRDPQLRVAAGEAVRGPWTTSGPAKSTEPARQDDGRAGRGRDLIERQEVDRDRGSRRSACDRAGRELSRGRGYRRPRSLRAAVPESRARSRRA